jgi:chemotaxis protein CheD
MVIMTQQTLVDNTISVSLAELKLSADVSRHLVCYGLGSCIGLCAYDPVIKLAGMAHIVLPKSHPGTTTENGTKFADIAVPILLEEMYKQGALKTRLVIKLTGGAQMIQMAGFSSSLEMGNKNIDATRQMLKAEGLRIAGEDVGGSHGRSVWLSVSTGEVVIRTAGQIMKSL